MTVAPGTVLLPAPPLRDPCGPAVINRIDARAAAVAAIAAYLRAATFMIWGAEASDTPFQLTEVREEWPEASTVLDYPSASLIDVTPTVLEAHNFVPTPLEDTLDVFGAGTVLWKIAEVSKLLQLDVFCTSKPEREAIAAQLPGLFAPGEDASRVVLAGHPVYYCQPVRCSLEEYQRLDEPQRVFEAERRFMARIRADIDVVELRRARVLTTSVQVEAGETVDPALAPKPESTKLAPGCADC